MCTRKSATAGQCFRRAANGRETALKQALRQLLSDFLSAILFLVVYAVSGSLFAAAAIAVAAGVAQFARLRLTGRRVEPMQWMSLGLVVVLGGATLLTQNPRFMMIKPTIVHFAVAVVMLLRTGRQSNGTAELGSARVAG
jgi:intracellular septation protein